jgi:hypothetical protein
MNVVISVMMGVFAGVFAFREEDRDGLGDQLCEAGSQLPQVVELQALIGAVSIRIGAEKTSDDELGSGKLFVLQEIHEGNGSSLTHRQKFLSKHILRCSLENICEFWTV